MQFFIFNCGIAFFINYFQGNSSFIIRILLKKFTFCQYYYSLLLLLLLYFVFYLYYDGFLIQFHTSPITLIVMDALFLFTTHLCEKLFRSFQLLLNDFQVQPMTAWGWAFILLVFTQIPLCLCFVYFCHASVNTHSNLWGEWVWKKK